MLYYFSGLSLSRAPFSCTCPPVHNRYVMEELDILKCVITCKSFKRNSKLLFCTPSNEWLITPVPPSFMFVHMPLASASTDRRLIVWDITMKEAVRGFEFPGSCCVYHLRWLQQDGANSLVVQVTCRVYT